MGKSNKTVDSWLVLSYQSGNTKAFSLLVKRWERKLYKQAYWYTKDIELAKDVVQDSWSSILKKLHALKDSGSFGSWALTIVTRKALDALQRRKRNYEHLTAYGHEQKMLREEGIPDDKERNINKLLSAISKLPNDQRIVLNLFYLEEYSLHEIGAVTHVSMNTVKTRLFRAREKLKNIIKSEKK